jgi:hypothetical protein
MVQVLVEYGLNVQHAMDKCAYLDLARSFVDQVAVSCAGILIEAGAQACLFEKRQAWRNAYACLLETEQEVRASPFCTLPCVTMSTMLLDHPLTRVMPSVLHALVLAYYDCAPNGGWPSIAIGGHRAIPEPRLPRPRPTFAST